LRKTRGKGDSPTQSTSLAKGRRAFGPRRAAFGPRRAAFTLIELLIVVAIIAILAAIAVPNLLEAQTRSKVSRSASDLRSIGVALEAYCVDSSNYPPENYPSPFVETASPWDSGLPNHIRLKPLTTPVAYVASLPRDPFASLEDPLNHVSPPTYHYAAALDLLHPEEVVFFEGENLEGRYCQWILQGNGPDRDPVPWQYPRYDPTNGASSVGNVIRVGP